jgi:hypothetical protein
MMVGEFPQSSHSTPLSKLKWTNIPHASRYRRGSTASKLTERTAVPGSTLRGVKLPHEIEFTAEAVVTRNPASRPAGLIVVLQKSIVHQSPLPRDQLAVVDFRRVSKTWGDPFKNRR